MKQKDIAVIIVVAFISAVASFIISGKVFVTTANRAQTAQTVEPINADFTPPDKKYFTENSIDPTQPITIGPNDNSAPFNSVSP